MFEWDEAKRRANLDRRGLDFEDADLVFDGRPVTTAASLRNNEDRLFRPPRSVGSFTRPYGCGEAVINGLFPSGEQAVAKKEHIVRYSAEELAEKRKRGATRSDWARAAAMTEAEIAADIASDPDEADMAVDWDKITVELPKPKADLHMRIDRDVLDYFRSTGRGYQTRINAVLRSYVERMRHE
jgi:uncharacterized protein (DUF4415 family)